jgi:nuclear transport factor 2 (NTF2) superfamily protein
MNPNFALPISSRQETLETISRNQLALLFDPAIFELRPEVQRDKGIDIIGEIKQNGVYTNFRFAIQLKSTESVRKQRDGSVSYPVEISNLNYLLNLGLPGFYILYDYPANQFYIASVAEVYRSLSKKYPPDQLPKSYKVKFTRLLNQQQIDGIYKETFENGTLLKKLSAHIRVHAGTDQQANGFVIDELQDVYSVEQNIEFINEAGYDLLNQHAFTQIVEIEQRTHPRSKASATFNMICGVAYFQQANLFKAMELLKLAHNEIESLHPEDQSMLSYTLAHAKYLLGLMSEPEFRKETAEIVTNENAGTFLQLEHLYNRFIGSKETEQGPRIKKYYESAVRIVDKHPEFHDMRVVAHAKILNAEATLLLHELAKNSLLTMGRKIDVFRDLLITDWLKFDDQFLSQLQELYGFALKHRNFLALSNLMMEKIEWEFAKVFHFHAFSNWNKEKLTINSEVAPDDRELLLKLLADIEKIAETYDRLQQRENQFNCLRRKYEILDFLGNKADAEQCSKVMKELISAFEMNALRRRFEQMQQGNMKHRIFLNDLSQRRASVDHVAKNSGIYEHLYGDINEEVNKHLNRKPEWSLTELFPLTYPDETPAK